jgi:hypothetical protein
MSRRRFFTILIIIAVIGLLITVAHSVFIYFAYRNSSIIQFIARELWL